jgi:large subunit ribosomal protein L32e
MRKVQPGFRTNKLVRGLHHSGLVPVVINSLNHIQLLNKNQHGAVVGRAVGNRKRLLLIEALKKHGITVLNLKEGHEKKIQEAVQQRKHVRESKAAKKTERRSKKQEKKEEKKERSQEEKEAHEKKEKDRVLTKAEK